MRSSSPSVEVTTYFGIEFIFSAKSAVALGPGPGEAFVGDAADQVGVGLEHLLEFVLELFVAHEVHHPAAVGMPRLSARGLHHAVEGDELGDDQLLHRTDHTAGRATSL